MLREFKIFSHNLTFDLRTDADKSVFEEVFVDKDYGVLDLAIKQSNNCILDLGAHKGFFSTYASLLNKETTIFAFEAEEVNSKSLKENLKLNHVDNVIFKNFAIAGKDGKRVLHISYDSHNHSLLDFVDQAGTRAVSSISLQTVFDRYLFKARISKCDLVKMDLEGAEFEVINSMPASLFAKINCFYIEYHEYSEDLRSDDLVKRLEQNGFIVSKKPSFYDKRMGYILAQK